VFWMGPEMQKILFVHLDLAVRDKVSFLLEHSGFRVVGAPGAQQTMTELGKGCPDLIIMAEQIRILNGDELCMRIRQVCQTPIVILGQNHEEAAGIEFLEMGADAYLTSPLNMRELLARVRSLLRRYGEKR
jgi:DNA-binding response OmpR family regulator